MHVQTTRFGAVEVSDKDILHFPEGLLGFANCHRFVLLDDPNDEIFAWLQSCEEPGLAFPVLEPEIYAKSYKVNLSKHDLEALGMSTISGTRVFNIITIPADVTQMTANLKAPVVINVAKRQGKQVVLQENDYQIKFPIFAELQKRVVQNPKASLKSQAAEWGLGVRLSGVGSRPPEVEA